MSTGVVQLMTDQYRETIVNRIEEYSARDDDTGCLFWHGGFARGYARLKLTVEGWGAGYQPVHRLVYVLAGKTEIDQHEMSHLCHTKKCIKLSHLSNEPKHVNQQRNTCNHEKVCFGHGDLPECIFQ